jgi:hypothetical protein
VDGRKGDQIGEAQGAVRYSLQADSGFRLLLGTLEREGKDQSLREAVSSREQRLNGDRGGFSFNNQ